MDGEWTPWIEHNGMSEPETGLCIEREYANGVVLVGIMGVTSWSTKDGLPSYSGACFTSSWIWGKAGDCVPVIRYRIRKPKGLAILEELLADIPETVGAI